MLSPSLTKYITLLSLLLQSIGVALATMQPPSRESVVHDKYKPMSAKSVNVYDSFDDGQKVPEEEDEEDETDDEESFSDMLCKELASLEGRKAYTRSAGTESAPATELTAEPATVPTTEPTSSYISMLDNKIAGSRRRVREASRVAAEKKSRGEENDLDLLLAPVSKYSMVESWAPFVSLEAPPTINISPENLKLHRQSDLDTSDLYVSTNLPEEHIKKEYKACDYDGESSEIIKQARAMYNERCLPCSTFSTHWAPIVEEMEGRFEGHLNLMYASGANMDKLLSHAKIAFQMMALKELNERIIDGQRRGEYKVSCQEGDAQFQALFLDGFKVVSGLFKSPFELACNVRTAVSGHAPLFEPFMFDFMNEVFQTIVYTTATPNTKIIQSSCGVSFIDDVVVSLREIAHVEGDHQIDWISLYLGIREYYGHAISKGHLYEIELFHG